MFFPNPENVLMQKHHLNNYWTGEKIPFSFPIPRPPLRVLWACNIIRDVNHNFKNVGEK